MHGRVEREGSEGVDVEIPPLEFSFLSGEFCAGEFLVGRRCARSAQFLLSKAGGKLSRASMCTAKVERAGSESVGNGAS